MTKYGGLALGEAVGVYFAENALPPDGGYGLRWWPCRFGRLTVKFYNFDWRKRAIARHDLHHIITGFECSLAGEIQMAAWEFGAGPFQSLCARLFCLPLVLLGAVVLPRRTFAAYVLGRRSVSLYDVDDLEALYREQVEDLRKTLLPRDESRASYSDYSGYGLLVAKAFLVLLALPIAGILLLFVNV